MASFILRTDLGSPCDEFLLASWLIFIPRFGGLHMENLKGIIQNAIDKKKVPNFQHGSSHDLAHKLGLAFPVSLRKLIIALGNLPPISVILSSGEMNAGFVHGWAQLGFQSDGLFSFRGHVHESGEVGDNFLFAVALLDVKDSAGKPLVFPQDGWVAGQLDFGPSDRDFQGDGFHESLRGQWDTARNSRFQFQLHVSTNAWQVTEVVIIGLFTLAAAAVIGYGAAKCDWYSAAEIDPDTGQPKHSLRCDLK
jgi:hypothetical protein